MDYPKFDDYSLIKTGDMPGDKVEINESHVEKAKVIYEEIKSLISSKSIISVYGGSGVGKSETASVLGYILNHKGLNTYIISGDNYPHRIPEVNDRERMRVFREYALKGLVNSGNYSKYNRDVVFDMMKDEGDLNVNNISKYPFLNEYIEKGIEGLKNYLGTFNEIDFVEINKILRSFKNAEDKILLKRMGRTIEEFWYDEIDFSSIDVLIIEWTHGNNKNLEGVDIPVLLNSTPEETLAHRASRNRDGKVDSPFVKTVLEIEQGLIHERANTAKVIINKAGKSISYEEYLAAMGE